MLRPIIFSVVFIYVSTLIRCQTVSDNDEIMKDAKLIFAHVLYRHGDRTPIETYPTDPYGDPKYWPAGWGQLTNVGKRQHYILGKWLRNRYDSLVNESIINDNIYVRSTDVDRTLMSAESNLAGMFEPRTRNEIWNPQIDWQPIPVHTIPENIDVVLANKKPCPAFNYALSKLMHTDYFTELDRRFQPLYEYLTKMSGRKIDTILAAQRLYDTFFIETTNNLTLPDWTRTVYPSDDLTFIARLSFQIDIYTPILARLKAGPLLKDMLDRFQDKFNGNLDPNRSLWIYSAHDTTVANILGILGVYELHVPPYTACVMVEMWLSNNKPYISVFYKNTTGEPQRMKLPQCGAFCPLETMFKLYKDVMPVDWETECHLSMLSMTYEDANITPAMVIVACGSMFLVALILLYIGITQYRRKQYFDYEWYMRIDS